MSNWNISSAPGGGIVASATTPAVAGRRNVLSSFSCTVFDGLVSAATIATWVIRDGASGVGPIIKTGNLQYVYNGVITESDLAIYGSVNTAMTIEFTAAGAAAVAQSVEASGHTF